MPHRKKGFLYTGLNPPMTGKESQNKNFDMVLGTIFRICNFFQRRKQKLYNYISPSQGSLKF
jgi:hypothetical protein